MVDMMILVGEGTEGYANNNNWKPPQPQQPPEHLRPQVRQARLHEAQQLSQHLQRAAGQTGSRPQAQQSFERLRQARTQPPPEQVQITHISVKRGCITGSTEKGLPHTQNKNSKN